MEILKNQTTVNREIDTLKNRLRILDNSFSKLSNEDYQAVLPITQKLVGDIEFLQSKHEWVFNFTSGGWNTVYATNLKGAIIEANKKYAGDPSLVPDPKTFSLQTAANEKILLSLFY